MGSMNFAKISFYFPQASQKIRNKKNLLNEIMKSMRKDGNVKRAGYLKEKDFYESLSKHIGKNTFAYHGLPSKKKRSIERELLLATKKCQSTLPHPNPPIFIFLYPWFPNPEDRVLFEGATAFAAYYTLHFFIDENGGDFKKVIRETMAHEWNHLVFYRYHSENKYPLGTHMVIEGLAEVFREEIMKGKISPWSSALGKTEAIKKLGSFSKDFLGKRDAGTYREVFFGSKKHKRWSGYSIGYWAVKEFRKKNKDLSWRDIIEVDPKNILNALVKKGT